MIDAPETQANTKRKIATCWSGFWQWSERAQRPGHPSGASGRRGTRRVNLCVRASVVRKATPTPRPVGIRRSSAWPSTSRRRRHHDRRPHRHPTAAANPNPDLQGLERLIGTWNVSGGAQGTATYEWMEGGFFLIQHVELEQYGQKTKGIEIIGHEQQFGAEPSADIKSRFYDNLGNTLDYVYELEGDTLTIWGGEKGSPAYYKGTFRQDGTAISGAWVYPGGGGYESTMTRAESS